MKDGDSLFCDLCGGLISSHTGKAGRPKRFHPECLQAWRKMCRNERNSKPNMKAKRKRADALYRAKKKAERAKTQKTE